MTNISQTFTRRRGATYAARMLSGDMTEHDVRDIQTWRQARPENQQELLATLDTVAGLDALADHPDIRAVLQEPRRVRVADKTRERWPLLAAVASLLLAVSIGFGAGWWQSAANDNVHRYTTGLGEQKEITLADGSTITLNTGTQLLVDITGAYRRVLLERGEAFFSVAHDPARPFTVDIDSRAVSVLGTRFSIRKVPDKFTLAVVEGVVALHRKEEKAEPSSPVLQSRPGEVLRVRAGEQRRVTAGMVAEYDGEADQITTYEPPDMDKLLSWRRGLLRFENESLIKVVQELNRYSEKKILVEDAGVVDLEVFAAIRIDRLNIALSDLERTLPIKVTHNYDRIAITGAREE